MLHTTAVPFQAPLSWQVETKSPLVYMYPSSQEYITVDWYVVLV